MRTTAHSNLKQDDNAEFGTFQDLTYSQIFLSSKAEIYIAIFCGQPALKEFRKTVIFN